MSSEKFESIQEDFNSLCLDTKKKIEDKLPRTWGEEKKKLQREIQKQLEEAESLLVDLDEEVRQAPQPFRGQMFNKVKNFRFELSQLTIKLQHTNKLESLKQQELYAADNSNIDPVDVNNRVRLLQTNEIVSRTTDRVLNSQQIAAETDEIGNEIVTELGGQREKLINAKDRLHETDQALSRSRRILNTMYRRVITNKLILALIILVEIAIFVGVLYGRFFKK